MCQLSYYKAQIINKSLKEYLHIFIKKCFYSKITAVDKNAYYINTRS
ncbi:hypothetical protein H376_10 [Rickettsia prowazekii str. GvF12]|nr:hypothetical protein H374_3240 [Rickettsia prowazekii str. NMRC Madrid E]AGJ01671.1 hypothetical protein H374_3830 [Rickettsia prowazekii str. NMRC Madrid E]EOB10047.1 hypothetical protein H377_5950 [Rickettsia prowazekii str. Cairo 3]EOB10854.1 hypothetical protein H376_10 [Rickettsia prowazekii str. GvF12]